MSFILYAKTLHFIALISWMAAIFYLPRLFIYHREALEQDEPTKSILSTYLADYQRRLYKIIMNPAMMVTFVAGFAMIFGYGWEWFAANHWLHAKLVLLAGLVYFHLQCKQIMQRLATGEKVGTSTRLRLFNEIPTLLMIAIVLLAVFKNGLNAVLAMLGLITVGGLLFLGVRFYKKLRAKESKIL